MFRLTPPRLAVLCVSSALWAFSFGLGAPLASLWLRDAASADTMPGLGPAAAVLGGPDTVIGLNTSIYYLGIALASAVVPGMMRRRGRGCPAAGMVVSGLTTAALPWSGPLAVWLGLRFLNGVAGALSLIPVETFVNRQSAPHQRGRNFGFYAFAVALGWALGNLIGLQLYADAPRLAFVLGGLAGVLAGVNLRLLPWPPEPEEVRRDDHPIPIRRNILSFGSAWCQGFLEGGMVAFLAVYLLRFLEMGETRVSWLTSGIMIGVILFQVPVAWLADRLGRTVVLVACYGATAAGLSFLPFCGAASVWLMPGLFLVGACSGAFYPLGLAILGETLPEARLARAGAWYLAINCCGSLIGPVVTGAFMDYFGKPAMFVVGEVAVLNVLAVWAFTRYLLTAQGRTSAAGEPLQPAGEWRRSA